MDVKCFCAAPNTPTKTVMHQTIVFKLPSDYQILQLIHVNVERILIAYKLIPSEYFSIEKLEAYV